jgi:CyaY protein
MEKMDDAAFATLADQVFKRVLAAVDSLEPEIAEADRAGDVVTVLLRGKRKCILNTQRPTHQLWLACGTQAWHFGHKDGMWQDDKGRGELFAILGEVVKAEAGVALAF